MPRFTVTSQPPAEFKVGQVIDIDADYTSSHLKTGFLYMANLDIIGSDGKENGKACPPTTCSAQQTPSAGKPQRLSFSFRAAVRQEGTWYFRISLYSRKEHLGNDFSYVGEVNTRQVKVKK